MEIVSKQLLSNPYLFHLPPELVDVDKSDRIHLTIYHSFYQVTSNYPVMHFLKLETAFIYFHEFS